MKLSLLDVQNAAKTISGQADNTPLVPSPFMSEQCGQDFLLKLENMQPIGAFKLRGALNAVLALPDGIAGVTCCSSGNHGRGIAFAAKMRGMRAVVCMSSIAPQAKVDGIRALGAEVRIIGDTQDEANIESLRLAREEGLVEVSPFDDPAVIAGQGTIALEILAARPDVETLLVPLSGGGLAGGVALAAKAIKPDIQLVGVTMDRGAGMHEAIRAGKPTDVPEFVSLADALGGGIGLDNKLTFPLCRDLLDETVLVTEEEIRDAMQVLFFEDRIVAEGGAVVGLAAVLAGKVPDLRGPVATIISGRNADMARFTKIMAGEDVMLGDLVLPGRTYPPT